jgi:hypothetical protein
MTGEQPSLLELQARYETQRALDARKAAAVAHWMHDVSGPGWRWFVKILRGNDTLLNDTNQAGPYVSRRIVFDLFPSFELHARENRSATIPVRVDSHGIAHDLNVRWWGLKKSEAHLTGWGGRRSPVLDPEATGSILVMAFRQPERRDAEACRVWLCSSVEEEDEVQERVGPVEPGVLLLYDASGSALAVPSNGPADSPCTLTDAELPAEWRLEFPTAAEVVAAAVARLPTVVRQPPDERLVKRRDCEYQLFRSIEQKVVLPRIRSGFTTVDLFVDYANSVTNRRKSRSGASLGLQTSRIFTEEQLSHSYDRISEGNKRPDFLFPSAEAYQGATSSDRIAVLAAKTTCKDRWRQILNEADKIPVKHLLTLQEGISLNQFEEMEQAGVVLVVPSRLHRAFHEHIVPKLVSVTQFIEQTKERCGPV